MVTLHNSQYFFLNDLLEVSPERMSTWLEGRSNCLKRTLLNIILLTLLVPSSGFTADTKFFGLACLCDPEWVTFDQFTVSLLNDLLKVPPGVCEAIV